jgi:hypothetical protein
LRPSNEPTTPVNGTKSINWVHRAA